MNDVNDWNRRIIQEFRENGGVCGGVVEGNPLLVLHSTGAKSGPTCLRSSGTRSRRAIASFR